MTSYKIDRKEIDIVEGCLRNDRKYQKMLYDKYKDAMYTVALRIVGGENDACDVLQDGFVQIFKDLPTFKGKSSLGAWIKTIIVRTAVRIVKKRKPIESLEEQVLEVEELILWPTTLSGEHLYKAIQSLPDGCKTVFLLVEVEGYKHREVAEMLGISQGTSKSQLFQAKKMLKKKLEKLTD